MWKALTAPGEAAGLTLKLDLTAKKTAHISTRKRASTTLTPRLNDNFVLHRPGNLVTRDYSIAVAARAVRAETMPRRGVAGSGFCRRAHGNAIFRLDTMK